MGTSVRPFVNYNDENKGVSSTLLRTESILTLKYSLSYFRVEKHWMPIDMRQKRPLPKEC